MNSSGGGLNVLTPVSRGAEGGGFLDYVANTGRGGSGQALGRTFCETGGIETGD